MGCIYVIRGCKPLYFYALCKLFVFMLVARSKPTIAEGRNANWRYFGGGVGFVSPPAAQTYDILSRTARRRHLCRDLRCSPFPFFSLLRHLCTWRSFYSHRFDGPSNPPSCPICLSDILPGEVFTVDCANQHAFCVDCLYQHCSVQVGRGLTGHDLATGFVLPVARRLYPNMLYRIPVFLDASRRLSTLLYSF